MTDAFPTVIRIAPFKNNSAVVVALSRDRSLTDLQTVPSECNSTDRWLRQSTNDSLKVRSDRRLGSLYTCGVPSLEMASFSRTSLSSLKSSWLDKHGVGGKEV